jgi:hypothetical protein
MKHLLCHLSRKTLLIGGMALGVVLLSAMGLAACSASAAQGSSAQPTSTPTAQTFGRHEHLVRVVSVTGNTLTVATGLDKKSPQLTLTVSSTTKIMKYGQPATLSALQADEWIIVRGADAQHIQQINILGFGARGTIQTITTSGLTILSQKKAGTGTVAISVSGSTHIMEAGMQISLSDLQPGENIAAFGDKNSDGSLKALLVRVNLVSGQVTAISGNSITLSHGAKGTEISVTTSAATKYYLAGQQVSASQLQVNDTVAVAGPLANKTSVTATAIFIHEPTLAGKVTSVSGNTITMQTRDGVTWTVTVNSSTKYLKGGQPASLADVQTGSLIQVVGVKSGDNALTAAIVRIRAGK